MQIKSYVLQEQGRKRYNRLRHLSVNAYQPTFSARHACRAGISLSAGALSRGFLAMKRGSTMSRDVEAAAVRPGLAAALVVRHELSHMKDNWWWFALLGVLLVVCGTCAIIFPAITVLTTVAVTTVLGILLMVSGVATIVGAFFAGKWSGLLLQLLVGILYLAAGFVVAEDPVNMSLVITVFLSVSFMVLGAFRTVAALVLHFPQWGWVLLNGVVTLLAGIVIYRNLPYDSFVIIGLLVGIEMLFNGWTWIMLSQVLRNLPADSPS
jgi:uncharacterized membrane protein HdeD (DUF308 family)